MNDYCESAKKGRWCPDDLCHSNNVTLCGFDKECYAEVCRDEEEDGYEPEDDGDSREEAGIADNERRTRTNTTRGR